MIDVDLRVERDTLVVEWRSPRAEGEIRFDRLEGTSPRWLASADDVFGDLDRRAEHAVVDALVAWATANDESVGIWHDDAGIELLGE